VNREALKAQLIRHEGARLKPYHDTVGKLTIGVGRNLDDVGITPVEMLVLLDTDITRAEAGLRAAWPHYDRLDPVRQQVLVNMAFNLGVPGLLAFKNTLAAVERGDYEAAYVEMIDSKWAKQVGARATELSAQMKTGRV